MWSITSHIPYGAGIIQPTNPCCRIRQIPPYLSPVRCLWDMSRRIFPRKTKKETGEMLHRKTRVLLLTLKPVRLFFGLKGRPNSDLDTTITR